MSVKHLSIINFYMLQIYISVVLFVWNRGFLASQALVNLVLFTFALVSDPNLGKPDFLPIPVFYPIVFAVCPAKC